MLFIENIGEQLGIDETAVTNGELHTILTNKYAKGKKGSLVAVIKGTNADKIIAIIKKIPEERRKRVKEVTSDLSAVMKKVIRICFPNAIMVDDRFHVQQLVSGAVQEIRMIERREALKEENRDIKICREKKIRYKPKVFENGDTKKQLLARSNHLLFKPQNKWTETQKQRGKILFREYPEIKKAYKLSMMFRNCYENSCSISEGRESLKKWYAKVEEKMLEPFLTVAESIRLHEETILNYFINRSTNASAESFNSKIKGFRALVRGVRDKKFFFFRISKIYG